MSADNMLSFADFDPVTGKPTIDGFATTDAGVITTEAEPGYVGGGRMTIGGSGLPPVIIQTVKDGNTIVIGVSCRGDTSFDDIDGVVIGLRESGSNSAGPQRRIDVFPVWGDAPPVLDANNLGTGYGAANPDGANPGTHLAETADNPAFDIRTNKPSHVGPVYYERTLPPPPMGNRNWSQYTPAQAGTQAKYDVRVRSWKPAVAPGSAAEFAWSIEVRLPIDTSTGNTDWINLQDDFGLFISVIRGFRFNDGGDGVYLATQFKFPLGAPDLPNTISETTDIPDSSFGHGLKGASAATTEGVRIKNGSMGIGRRPTGNAAAALTSTISRVENNDIVALLENTGPAANGVRAEVRMANWGLPPATFASWNPPPGCANPSTPVNLPAGNIATPSSGETTNSWPAASVPSDYDAHSHQCMWVQLDATAGGVTFSQSSARRNMDFVTLSEENREVEANGNGYAKPASGKDHDFLLFTRCRKIVVRELVEKRQLLDPETIDLVTGALKSSGAMPDATGAHVADSTMVAARQPAQQWQNSVVYLWITEGFRRTGEYIEINGVKAERLDNGPGDFGMAAHHEGVEDNLSWSFSGAGLVSHGPGVYGLKVPHKGISRIKVRLAASSEEKPGDRSDLPKAPRPDSGGTGGSGKPKPGGCVVILFGLSAGIPLLLRLLA